jgi:AbrB family looped-hinge helix DNA binding protein
MTHSVLSVNEQGRVTIPAPLRQELGFQPGARLVAYVEDGRLVLEDRKHLLHRLQAKVIGETGPGSLVDELIDDRRVEAAREQSNTDGVS